MADIRGARYDSSLRIPPGPIGDLEKLYTELVNYGSAKGEKEKLEAFLSIMNRNMLDEYKFTVQFQFSKAPESLAYVDMKNALMLEYSRLLSQQGDTRQTPQTQKSAMLSVPAWQSLRQFAVYKT